jgi:ABC-2 type transport system ATP-binding protein
MIQRLGMARAILGNPPILILDEPSGGLDPRGVVLIRNKIRELRDRGATIFVSSHILGEIQEVCDRVGIINRGRLVAQDSVSELSQKLNLKPKITLELEELSKGIEESIKKVKGVDDIKIIDKSIEVSCDPKLKAKVIIAVEKAGGNIVNLQTKEPSLEEVFMRYTED